MDKLTCNLISKLNDGVKRHLLYVDVLSSYNVKRMLNYLQNLGLFFTHVRINSTHIRIYFKTLDRFNKNIILTEYVSPEDSNMIYRPFRRIEIFSHGSFVIYLPHREIIKYYWKLNTIYVFSTSQGYMTSEEAVKRNLGGKLLFRIHM